MQLQKMSKYGSHWRTVLKVCSTVEVEKICINDGCFIMYFDEEDALDGEEAYCSIDKTSLTQNDDSCKKVKPCSY